MAGGGIKINNTKIVGGADGATFTPMVNAEGYLSWSNNKGYTNPATVNIKGPKGDKGEKGDKGLQGVQGVAGPQGATGAKLISQKLVGQDEYGGNIYLQTFDDGTAATFTAPKGKKGEKGDMPDMSAYYTKAETDANLAEIERDIKVLGNALMQGGITYKPTTEDTYNERITAEGVNVVDGSEAVLQKVVGSTVRCENLIPYPYVDKTKELNGVILTVNDDRSVKIQGTATASIQFKPFRGKLPIGQYTLSSNAVEIGENSDSYGKLILRVSKNNAWYAEGKTVTFSVENETDVFEIYYYVTIGNTVNVTIRPMLNEGSTALPYQPYFTGLKSASFAGIESKNADGTETSTLAFPKTPTPMGTTIDFENKKIIEGSREIVLDGTENWVASDTQTAGKMRFCLDRWLNEKSAGTISTINSISSVYDSTTAERTYLNTNGLSVAGKNVWAYDETYATKTVDEWKAHLAELYASGNPVTVRYLLKTPIETPFTNGNAYRAYSGGTERVLGNDNAEYGVKNTLTQNYIVVKE